MLVGIVGKANVGKSTFFKALTAADIVIANYPFATIKPNHGIAFAKIDCVCGEFGKQCNPRVGQCVNKKRFVPVEVLDVAGLVPGAHEGKGMGNQFLDDLRQADAFIHVVDMSGSTNEKGEPVEPGSYDPAFDIRFLEIELDMWILSIIKKGWDKFARTILQEKKDTVQALTKQLTGLKVTEEIVESAIKALQLDSTRPNNWTEEELLKLAINIRKRTKPMLILANKMDIPSAEENLARCREQFKEYIFVPSSAESELALKEAEKKGMIKYIPGEGTFEIIGELGENQKKGLEFIQKFLDKHGSTGAQDAIDIAVLDLLKYIAIFPGGANKLEDKDGNTLPDCFLLPENSTALQFAEKIHTDLAKQFIAAIDVKTKRKIGRDAILKHRDVIEILI